MTAAGSATIARGQVAARSERDPFLDNAKFLLIVLVVVGHNWWYAIDDLRWVKAAYTVVYTFHVPAFVLLCGYFSRGFEGRPEQWRKLAVGVLVPYVIFQTAYAAEVAVLRDEHFSLHLSDPIYVCWFLLALFVWRACAPLLRSLPHPLLLSVLVSLAAGLTIPSTAFALSRALQLLPWFVLGLQLRPHHFALLRRRGVRIAAVVTMAGTAAVAYLLAPLVDVRWLDRKWFYGELKVSAPADLAIAFGLDLVTLVLVAAALALIPGWRPLGRLGALTMYPFLLHGLVVRLVHHVGVTPFLIGLGDVGVLILTAGAVLLAALLTVPPVRLLTRWAVEPGSLRLLGRLGRERGPEVAATGSEQRPAPPASSAAQRDAEEAGAERRSA